MRFREWLGRGHRGLPIVNLLPRPPAPAPPCINWRDAASPSFITLALHRAGPGTV